MSTENGDTTSWELIFEVAEIDGRVAGSLWARTNESDSLLTFRKTMLEIGVMHREMLGMLWRIRFYSRVKHHFPRDALIIDNVATFPEFRRMGIANILIERAIGLGRRKGGVPSCRKRRPTLPGKKQ